MYNLSHSMVICTDDACLGLSAAKKERKIRYRSRKNNWYVASLFGYLAEQWL